MMVIKTGVYQLDQTYEYNQLTVGNLKRAIDLVTEKEAYVLRLPNWISKSLNFLAFVRTWRAGRVDRPLRAKSGGG